MNNLINITNQNGSLVVSSREVAENFDKSNSVVNRAIENLVEETSMQNCTHLFIPSIYKDTYEREQNEYLLTRDGFSLLVMGFTGKKALEWKLKYIEAFNKMEEMIRNNNLATEKLSPQLQFLINMELKQKELETVITETKEEVQAIRDAIIINPGAEWRKDTNKILTIIGKGRRDYQSPKNEVYEALKQRGKCRPDTLVTNLKSRALMNGMSKSKVDNLGILDVLENEPRLREIYISIVKEMAIKHKIA